MNDSILVEQRPAVDAVSTKSDILPFPYRGEGLGSRSLDSPKETVVRGCLSAIRVKDPDTCLVANEISSSIPAIVGGLRRPSSEDVELGIRHAVWPLAAIVFG